MEQPDSHPLFERSFGSKPKTKSFAPGRINIIGEHVDYNEGLVLPTPLALGIDVSLTANGSEVMAASTLSGDVEAREMTDAPNGSWTDYVVGAAQIVGVTKGFKIAVDSNLPAGASVSSSAALLVSVIQALNSEYELHLSQQDIARAAQRVENEYLGLKNGLMDQMVSACGTFGKALLFDTQNGSISDHDLIPGTSILTIHSGQTRRLVGNEYNDRRESCDRAAAAIGVPSLRHASLDDLPRVKDLTDMARARHIISEHDRTLAVLDAISRADAQTMGQHVTDCHWSLANDFEVSTPAMDALVETALEHGALGARMTGAGFGGCIIVFSETKKAEQIRSEILGRHDMAYDVATLHF